MPPTPAQRHQPLGAVCSDRRQAVSYYSESIANKTNVFDCHAATTALPSFNAAIASNAAAAAAAPATAAPAAAPKLGLGGVDSSAAQPKHVEGRSESARAKEAQVPQEIVATVEALKQHIKQQKQFSSDIARTSTHKLFNVSTELQALNRSLADVANCVQTNSAAIKQLRYETAGAIRQAEMAQRTQEIQPGLQFENTAPLRYFAELAQKFESDMLTFRAQVELTEKHMRSLANPQSLSADDLKRGLNQMHESFVALAGRVHETHQKVETQKEQYLNLRKHLLKDKTNVFAESDGDASDGLQTMANISCGPTPFSATFSIHLGATAEATSSATAAVSATNSQSAFGNATGGGGGGASGFGMLGQSTMGGGSFFNPTTSTAAPLSFGFGSAAAASTSAFGQNTSGLSTTSGGAFNLQNPPIGSKRNKQ